MLTVCYINRQPARGYHDSKTNACGESAASNPSQCIGLIMECMPLPLTHISLASFLWDIRNMCRHRLAFSLGSHCLLTESSIKNEIYHQWKLTGPTDKWEIPFGEY